MKNIEFKSNRLCGVLKTSKAHQRHQRTAVSKRLDFIKSTMTDVKEHLARRLS